MGGLFIRSGCEFVRVKNAQNLGIQAMFNATYKRKNNFLCLSSPVSGCCCGKYFSQMLFLFYTKNMQSLEGTLGCCHHLST